MKSLVPAVSLTALALVLAGCTPAPGPVAPTSATADPLYVPNLPFASSAGSSLVPAPGVGSSAGITSFNRLEENPGMVKSSAGIGSSLPGETVRTAPFPELRGIKPISELGDVLESRSETDRTATKNRRSSKAEKTVLSAGETASQRNSVSTVPPSTTEDRASARVTVNPPSVVSKPPLTSSTIEDRPPARVTVNPPSVVSKPPFTSPATDAPKVPVVPADPSEWNLNKLESDTFLLSADGSSHAEIAKRYGFQLPKKIDRADPVTMSKFDWSKPFGHVSTATGPGGSYIVEFTGSKVSKEIRDGAVLVTVGNLDLPPLILVVCNGVWTLGDTK